MPLADRQGLPPLVFLEEFTQGSLARWRAAGRNLERFSHDLFFALEARRAKYSAELIDAVRSATTKRFESSGWARLVNWQFTNQPLSMAGSVRGDGGRFDVGSALDPATYTPFPALYVAKSTFQLRFERFGIDASSFIRGLTAHEFILRRESSFSHLAVNLWLENVLDVGDLSKLKPVSDILKKIRLPSRIAKAARQLRLRPPALIRTASGLQSQILSPNWRVRARAVRFAFELADLRKALRRRRRARHPLSVRQERRQALPGALPAELERHCVIHRAGWAVSCRGRSETP